ncbi:hypothetical protein AcW1_000920 [Taiwanofungus camphoratus]|nr:hypothetical protein AcV5_004824 [Antrodia cinnamomea]KAI0961994.1 hypothetical protein AcV7_000939 [Antrodia cinnamomea]KAI0963998.1 hypothetical protein AcW1_000920 [Antrodia cinnamomea]
MYWAVVGAFVTFEFIAEWLISWIPLYWETKTLFLLFLSLPQTEGSTWIYTTYLHPFLTNKEADIDAGIVAAKTNIITFLHDCLLALWQTIGRIAWQTSPPTADHTGVSRTAPAGPSPLNVAQVFWNAVGPFLTGASGPTHADPAHRPTPLHSESSSSFNSMDSDGSSVSSSHSTNR